MTPRKTQPAPQLDGVPKQAADELRSLTQTVYRLQSRLAALEGVDYLTKQAADALYSPPVMARELSATGSAPLNVVLVGGRNIIQAQPVARRK